MRGSPGNVVMADRATPDISIVIPAYREGRRINALIEHVHRLDGASRCEIIVVDGETPPTTAQAVLDPGVRTLTSPKGRGPQMNAGAAVARGNTLLFLHADTFLPERAVDLIVDTMSDSSLVAGAFSLRFDSRRHRHNVFAWLASMRSRLTRIPFGDHAIFIRREYFTRIGGYEDIPIMEDVALMRRIKHDGRRIRILRDCVQTSARRLEREGMVYCTLRGAILLCLFELGCSPRRLKVHYPDEDPA